MNYIKTTIGEHCTVTSSKRFHLSERSGEGVPFYCSKEIIQKVKGETVTECDYIREELYEQIKREYGVPQSGDLLITTRGTYGIPYIYAPEDRFYFADGNLTWLKDFDNLLMPEYLYYWILSHEGQSKIDAIAKGTAQKAVPIALIKTLKLNLPSNEVQKQVVQILSTYDSLLDNCRRQIKLLEEAARRLYREWFVDLRFPGHEHVQIVDGVPEGWNKVLLNDLIVYEIGGGWGEESISRKNEEEAYVIRGTDFYGITHGNMADLPCRFHGRRNLDARKLFDGDILFEVSGGSKNEGVARTVLIKQALLDYLNKPVMCASFCKLIRTNSILSVLLYYHFQYLRQAGITEQYDKRSASSIVNYRWQDFMNQESVLIPSPKLLETYNALANPIYEKITRCSLLIAKLRKARDRLLPKLMSGEIELYNDTEGDVRPCCTIIPKMS